MERDREEGQRMERSEGRVLEKLAGLQQLGLGI